MSVRSMQQPPSSLSASGGAPPLSSVGAQEGGALPSVTTPPAFTDAELVARRARAVRQRRLRIYGLRLLFAVVWIGSWELTTRMGLVDAFFFGQPSAIVGRLVTWITQGTTLGPLWYQVLITMEETVLGFLVGAILGIAFGVVLGRIELLAQVLSPFIRAANSIPRVV